ncbi:hypothetical protein [Variovorax sp. RA8]|uniref:hypothetical protein n=1 Tax=Variovorax sp. (strain JCM 16519 / RA8) TaxID=662548 RepID=UPI000A85BF92|nr:hypothetical protein [Variovorax sp. RA8]
MVETDREVRRSPARLALTTALATASALLVVLYMLSPPRWETNDDVAMSMVTHGYGIAAPGAPPYLMFSNVLWGYMARSIPAFGGLLGYSTATIGALSIACAAVTYGMLRLGAGCVPSLAAAGLLFVRPMLFPQFTVNAGMLMVAAAILWCVHSVERPAWALAASALLALLSYLIRSQECLLVLAVALPLLSWRPLRSRRVQGVLLAVCCAIAAAAIFDHRAYQAKEWQEFNALNPVRARLTDFRAGESLRKRPDIVERHGYSLNDVALMEKWFFVDPGIADPVKLDAMLAEAGPLPRQDHAWANALISLKALGHPSLWVFVVVGVLGAMLRPSRGLFMAWAIFLAAIVAMGFLGRPGIIRVYLPVVSLLAIAPLLQRTSAGSVRNRALCAVLLLAAAANAFNVLSESRSTNTADAHARARVAGFPDYPVVIWGGGFPFEAVYPVLGASQTVLDYKLYGLGVSTLAPFSVARAEDRAGRGMIARLLAGEGVPLVASDEEIRLLGVYCREHHGGQLQQTERPLKAGGGPSRYRCVQGR